MKRQILHVDVNNAFLSWTAVDRLKKGETLDIRTIPAIIGGDEAQRKGIVLAKSPIAKQFGIQTGEPIYFARKKCPEIFVFQSDFSVYYQYSNALYELLLEYSDKIERFSIDECFIDMTNFIPKGRNLLELAYEINKRIEEELGFTVNVGVAHNKLLAKMASDFEKPNKVHTLWEEEMPDKMWKLPVNELFMVGKKSLPKLQKMGIKTIGDLAKKEESIFIKTFGKFGKMIWEYANGIDGSPICYEPESPKCIGNSVTLPYDYVDKQQLEVMLLTIVEQVAYRLRNQHLLAQVINVQLKTNTFRMYSHQRKLDIPTDSSKVLQKEAKKLLEELFKGIPIRLIGVRVDQLTDGKNMQLSLFQTQNNEKQKQLDQVVDNLKEKYGYEKITKASNLKNPIKWKQ